MLAAAIKALSQMLSPPFRTVLLKSVGLALVLVVLLGMALQRLFVWLATSGQVGPRACSDHSPTCRSPSWHGSSRSRRRSASSSGRVFLMPAVSALVGSFFADDIALEVERAALSR